MLFDARRALPQVNRDVLDAADYIREHGWCQHTYRTQAGVCVLGAIYALGLSPARMNDVAGLLCTELGVLGIGNWNDAPGRTKEQVLARLEEIGWGDGAG